MPPEYATASGTTQAKGKRGRAFALEKQIEQGGHSSRAKQKFVMEILDMEVQQAP